MMRALGTQTKALGRLAAGVFGAVDGGMMTGTLITRKTLSSTFFGYGYYGIAGSYQHIVHQLILIFHCLPGTLAH